MFNRNLKCLILYCLNVHTFLNSAYLLKMLIENFLVTFKIEDLEVMTSRNFALVEALHCKLVIRPRMIPNNV